MVVVPYRELAAPPPLTDEAAAAPGRRSPCRSRRRPSAAPVPVPDAEAPPEQTIASQEEIAQSTPGCPSGRRQNIAGRTAVGGRLPKFGDYVYVEELPEAITKVNPVYPDIAREAGVDGTVMVQALVGKDGKVKDTARGEVDPDARRVGG